MTISPPSKVKLREDEPARVLVTGIDALVLSLDVIWQHEAFFELLDERKEQARGTEHGAPIDLYDTGHTFSTVNVRGYGSDGYDFLLVGKEFSLKIGRWKELKTRPSVMMDLRSEALWQHGPARLVERVLAMLSNVGADIKTVKPSRLDLCMDLLLPESVWCPEIVRHFVTRAVKTAQHSAYGRLTGITVGSGDISARIYDKPVEIFTKSNKIWMFDIWGLQFVPDKHAIARVEFQLRREALKELGMDVLHDLFGKIAEIWAYCVRSWLKVQDDPTKHHTQRHTLPWWLVVQDSFLGIQAATPLIRVKAIRADRKQLTQQILGQMASLVALTVQVFELNANRQLTVKEGLEVVLKAIDALKISDAEFTERVKLKFARYRRSEPPKELS
jgi:hypothetical protein